MPTQIPVQEYFVRRLLEGVRHVHACLESARHGEPVDWGYLSENLMLFAEKVDDDSKQINPVVKIYGWLGLKAMVETVDALANAVGLRTLPYDEPY